MTIKVQKTDAGVRVEIVHNPKTPPLVFSVAADRLDGLVKALQMVDRAKKISLEIDL